MAVFVGTQQRREARIIVETRPAQLVDRAVAADECSGFTIAQQGVIFDRLAHVNGFRVKTA